MACCSDPLCCYDPVCPGEMLPNAGGELECRVCHRTVTGDDDWISKLDALITGGDAPAETVRPACLTDVHS